MRLRIQFEKNGPARFTSHKDVQRIFQRCFAAAGLPVAYSEGFHPHMKMSFGPPLRTGWASGAEYLDVFVEGPPGPVAALCNERLPEGFAVTGVALLPSDAPKLANDICAATYEFSLDAGELLGAGVSDDGSRAERLAEVAHSIQQHTGAAGNTAEEETPLVIEVRAESRNGRLGVTYTTTMISGRVVSPVEVLSGGTSDADAMAEAMAVRRCAQFISRGGNLVSPISKESIRTQS